MFRSTYSVDTSGTSFVPTIHKVDSFIKKKNSITESFYYKKLDELKKKHENEGLTMNKSKLYCLKSNDQRIELP